MKIKWNVNLVINIVAISCIIVMAVLYFVANSKIISFSKGDIYTPPIEQESSIDTFIPDTVTYRKYQQMKDSIKTIRYLKNGELFYSSTVEMQSMTGTGWAFHCDTCNLKWRNDQAVHLFDTANERHKQYYISLPGWGINNTEYAKYIGHNFAEFYVKNGQPILRKYDVETPVKFWFTHRYNYLLIPVSQSTETITHYIVGSMCVMFILYFFYLIACFINILIDVSKGLVFTDGNLRRLLTIAITFLATPAFAYLSCVSVKIIFHSYFTADVVMNKEVWQDSWKSICAGIVFLMLYKAFRQGKMLKEEQDLTV